MPWTLTVPENATPGDHPGGLVASVTQAVGGEGPQVGLDTRVGVRIHLRVKGDLAPAVAYSDVQTRYEPSLNPFQPGDLHVSYTLHNEGNVRVGSIQQWAVEGPLGVPAGGEGPSGSVIAQQREILPGQTTRVSEVVEDVWPAARLVTDLTAHTEPVGEDVLPLNLPTATATAVTWAIPWPQLAVVVLAGMALLALRRRRRSSIAQAIAAARAAGAREAAQARGARGATA